MAIDYSQCALPKSRPVALDKADRQKALEAKDKAESEKAKTCIQCGAVFMFGANKQRIGVFQRRKYCSHKCSRAAESEARATVRVHAARPCVVCGALADRPPAMASLRKTCSVACLRVYQRQQKEARRLSKACRFCGLPPQPNTRMAPGGFCSFECFQNSRRGKGKTRRPRLCEHCGAAFIAKLNYNGSWGRFCSQRCLSAKLSERPAMLVVQCQRCGASFRRTAAAVKRTKHVFCSRACASQFLTGEQSSAWRGGSDPNRGAGWVKLAERIRARDGYTCQRCTKTQVQNGERLSVDHIVPWRLFNSAAEANHPSNLISLCRDCHGWKTHVAERKMLNGDRILFEQYRRAISLPPLFAMAH